MVRSAVKGAVRLLVLIVAIAHAPLTAAQTFGINGQTSSTPTPPSKKHTTSRRSDTGM